MVVPIEGYDYDELAERYADDAVLNQISDIGQRLEVISLVVDFDTGEAESTGDVIEPIPAESQPSETAPEASPEVTTPTAESEWFRQLDAGLSALEALSHLRLVILAKREAAEAPAEPPAKSKKRSKRTS